MGIIFLFAYWDVSDCFYDGLMPQTFLKLLDFNYQRMFYEIALASGHKLPTNTSLTFAVLVMTNIGILFLLIVKLKKLPRYFHLLKIILYTLIIFFSILLLWLIYLEFVAIQSNHYISIDMRAYNWGLILIDVVILFFLRKKLILYTSN